MSRGYPTHIQKAFDELRFGPLRTLNLRESLPTADDARARTDGWIQAKQLERATEVLIITGRGNNSVGGVSAVRQSILALFPSLRRRNIITTWEEHTPGSFVATLAPLTSRFEAPKRRREPHPPFSPTPPSLAALSPQTRVLLRELATASLAALGVHDFESFLESEMLAKFATLSTALPDSEDLEAALQTALRHALDDLHEQI